MTRKATAYITGTTQAHPFLGGHRSNIPELLKNSRFKDDIKQICETFDTTTKLGFVDSGRNSIIRFGRFTDHDEKRKVHHGQLRLPG